MMHVLYRIEPDATTKEAARMLADGGATRLAVYKADRFLGWVTLHRPIERHEQRAPPGPIAESQRPRGL